MMGRTTAKRWMRKRLTLKQRWRQTRPWPRRKACTCSRESRVDGAVTFLVSNIFGRHWRTTVGEQLMVGCSRSGVTLLRLSGEYRASPSRRLRAHCLHFQVRFYHFPSFSSHLFFSNIQNSGNPRAGIGGPDDDMPPELDWGADETFTRQYIGAINAQEGWDAGHLGGAAGAAAAVAVAAAGGGGPVGAAAIHTFAHHLGPGDVTGNEGWLRGSAEDQLRLWGVQPPPGLARQYATTRHGDRGGAGVVSFVGECRSQQVDR